MRVMTLGQLAAPATPHLPSTESTLSALRGEPGGWGKVVSTTLLRALIIAPGVWVGGGRGWRLVGGSLVGSVGITAFLFLWHSMHEGTQSTPAEPQPQPVPAPGPDPVEGSAFTEEGALLEAEASGVTPLNGFGQVVMRRRRAR